MPKFASKSLKNYKELHPDLQRLLAEAIKYVDFSIICGFRSKEDQDNAYTRGTSKVQWPDSKHNSYPSEAADIVPYYKDGPHIRWNDKNGLYLFIGFIKGIAASMNINIRTGADWDGDYDTKDQSFHDLPHIELKR